jgi:hypothetical protein
LRKAVWFGRLLRLWRIAKPADLAQNRIKLSDLSKTTLADELTACKWFCPVIYPASFIHPIGAIPSDEHPGTLVYIVSPFLVNYPRSSVSTSSLKTMTTS